MVKTGLRKRPILSARLAQKSEKKRFYLKASEKMTTEEKTRQARIRDQKPLPKWSTEKACRAFIDSEGGADKFKEILERGFYENINHFSDGFACQLPCANTKS